jgi:DNA-binding transcriptional regulator PaaX
MSLVSEILEIVTSGYYGSYRKMRTRSFEWSESYPCLEEASDGTVASTISRLKKEGFIKENKKGLFTTAKGVKHLEGSDQRPRWPKKYPSKQPGDRGSTIITFDIPEKLRHQRDWLRSQLEYFDFEPLQKSVWIGELQIPQEFIKELGRRKILSGVHIFEVKLRGTLKN